MLSFRHPHQISLMLFFLFCFVILVCLSYLDVKQLYHDSFEKYACLSAWYTTYRHTLIGGSWGWPTCKVVCALVIFPFFSPFCFFFPPPTSGPCPSRGAGDPGVGRAVELALMLLCATGRHHNGKRLREGTARSESGVLCNMWSQQLKEICQK